LKHAYTGHVFREVAYTGYDVPVFIEWMDFSITLYLNFLTISLPSKPSDKENYD
jgi:hypothetical protein